MMPGPEGLYGVPAPAKINWFLHVLGRRPDGYHLLQTAFQFIDWCDRIDFELRLDGRVTRAHVEGLPDDDLSLRAARLLQQATGCGLGAHLTLRKSVPAQAGLGGGSSDAATTLLALNRLWGLGLSRQALCALGLQLGADVPVFVAGRNAFAEGVGEVLVPVTLPAWDLVVAWPGRGLATAAVFGAATLARDTPPVDVRAFKACLERRHLPGECDPALARATTLVPPGLDFGHNDLQPVAREALAELHAVEDWLRLRTGSRLVLMSGSGSAMFAPLLPTGEQNAPVPDPAWRVRACKALPVHPLHDWVGDATTPRTGSEKGVDDGK